MENTINSILLWTAPKIQRNVVDWIFTFNGWNLDNGDNIRVVQSNHDDIWTIDFDTYETPLQDGGWVLGKYYRKKQIQLILSVKADTPESFNDLIDEIKYQTAKTEWKLRIIINWIVRERTATCTSLKFNRKNYNVTRVGNVVLTFTCVNPHSQLEDPESASFISRTWSFQSSVIYRWRAETYPKLSLTMDSWSSTWMRFELNWYVIEINTSLTVGDIIIFDGETKSVTVNDTEVVYSWPFTPLTYGENIFSVNNDWTYSWSLSYFIKYL